MASAQIVLPVPGAPAKLNASARPDGMPLAKAPAIEDEVVTGDVDQGLIERAPRCRRQDHVVEAAAGHDRLDCTAGANQSGEGAQERVGHGSQDANPGPTLEGQASRSATTGSTRTARRAGMRHATLAVITSTAAAAT